jgi:transposase
MRAYSVDLRARIVRAVGNGLSKAEAARRYEVGLSTVKRYVRLGAGGSLRPGASTGRPRALDTAGEAALRAQVAAHPDATVAEHRRLWQAAHGAAPSRATLGRALLRVGWTRKKSR